MLARIVTVAAALCVMAILAVQLYAQRRLDDGRETAFLAGQSALEPDERRRVLDDLETAGALRPGTDALVARAYVQLRAGEAVEAARLARRAVEREPDNHVPWTALAESLRHADPAGARRAAERSRRLNPPVSP